MVTMYQGSDRFVKPLVTLKWAQTLDGRIATRSGSSRWISGPESRALAHVLRAEHDAVLVGVGTVIADDPLLTVRHVEGADPLRIVLDSSFRMPEKAALLHDGGRTVIATALAEDDARVRSARERGMEVLCLPAQDGRVALDALLPGLLDRGVRSILVEGGPTVITSFLRARLADELAIFVAPKIAGAGKDAVGELGIVQMADAIPLSDVRWQRVGDDLLIRATLGRGSRD
jgi:riboflavin-specific deaminase-like protein